MSTNTTSNEALPQSRMTAQHWARLRAMSEEQMRKNALEDPDNPPLEGAGDGTDVHIRIDPSYAQWLRDHQLDAGKLAASLLAQFVEAQTKI